MGKKKKYNGVTPFGQTRQRSGQPGPGGAPINVNVNDLPVYQCQCGSFEWLQAWTLRHLSGLQAPDGKDHIASVQTGWLCSQCGKRWNPEAEGNARLVSVEEAREIEREQTEAEIKKNHVEVEDGRDGKPEHEPESTGTE